jgi:hypothetical protein
MMRTAGAAPATGLRTSMRSNRASEAVIDVSGKPRPRQIRARVAHARRCAHRRDETRRWCPSGGCCPHRRPRPAGRAKPVSPPRPRCPQHRSRALLRSRPGAQCWRALYGALAPVIVVIGRIVYRIHRYGADLDQKIAPRGGSVGQLDVHKTIGHCNRTWCLTHTEGPRAI